MSNLPAFSEISDNLAFLEDWEDRYRYLIELGQSLPALSDGEKTAETKVQGCVSQVWLIVENAELDGQKVLILRGESDAMIVKGLVAVLIALYSGQTPQKIASTDAIALLDEMGLREHLTSQRSNGLVAMVKRIHAEAAARL